MYTHVHTPKFMNCVKDVKDGEGTIYFYFMI